MIGSLGNVGKIPELRNRILFTLAMLAIYRLGVFVSTPGIDVLALRRMFDTGDGTLFGLINMFSGGSLENFSIFTLGIMPYISVSIIIQFIAPAFPALEALKKEGASGQRVLTRYTRQGTIALALFQGFMIAKGLQSNQSLVPVGGPSFVISTMLTLTAGTAFIMWLGEQITERGIGNGMSIIIFAGIVARMPQVLVTTVALAREGQINPLNILVLLVASVGVVAGIVFVERSYRKIPLQYPRASRMMAKDVGIPQYLPFKVNSAGVIPPIFASALLMLPATIGSFFTRDPNNPQELLQTVLDYLTPGSTLYELVYVGLIIVFAYYYTATITNPVEIAENLKKNGAFVPTVRPGKETADYLYGVLNRLTFWGAIYIALICVLPQLIYLNLGATQFSYVFGGTAVLIAVGVTLDTASQIQSHMIARNYEAFMSKSAKSRGGAGAMSYMRTRILKR
jgi:preprotein translocase subunit SecY